MKSKFGLSILHLCIFHNFFSAQTLSEQYHTSLFLTQTVAVSSIENQHATPEQNSMNLIVPNNTPNNLSPAYTPKSSPESSPETAPKKLKFDNLASILDLQTTLSTSILKLQEDQQTLIEKFCNQSDITMNEFDRQLNNMIYFINKNFDRKSQDYNNHQNQSVCTIFEQLQKNHVPFVRVTQTNEQSEASFKLWPGFLEFNQDFIDTNELAIRNAIILYAIMYYKNNFDKFAHTMQTISTRNKNSKDTDVTYSNFLQNCNTQAHLTALLTILRIPGVAQTDWNTAYTVYQANNSELKKFVTDEAITNALNDDFSQIPPFWLPPAVNINNNVPNDRCSTPSKHHFCCGKRKR